MRFRHILGGVLLIFMVSCATVPINFLEPAAGSRRDREFFNAVRQGNRAGVDAALERRNVDTNISDRLYQTAFMWACWNGDLHIINALLDHSSQRRTRTLNVGAQSRYPDLQYNALFCFVMSNNIAPHYSRARETLARIIREDRAILNLRDSFGENVFHKLVRSNNNYFDVLVGLMNETDRKRLLNQECNYGITPLRLAVELGNQWMVEALVGQIRDGIKIVCIKDNDLPLLAFNLGNGNFEIFLNIFRGRMWHHLRYGGLAPSINVDFISEQSRIYQNTTSRALRERLRWFADIHNRYASGVVQADPMALYSRYFNQRRDTIFGMLERPIENEAAFFDELEYMPDAIYMSMWDDHWDMNWSFLEQVIRTQCVDFFNRIWARVDIPRLLPLNNGRGDLLTAAMLDGNTDIMHTLLDRFPAHSFREGVMHPETRIATNVSMRMLNLELPFPLQIFCIAIAPKMSDEGELLRKMARFYQPRFHEHTHTSSLLSVLVQHNQHDNFNFFLGFNENFFFVHNLSVDSSLSPVVEVLLNRAMLNEEWFHSIQKYFSHWRYGARVTLDHLRYFNRNREAFFRWWSNPAYRNFRANNSDLQRMYNELRRHTPQQPAF